MKLIFTNHEIISESICIFLIIAEVQILEYMHFNHLRFDNYSVKYLKLFYPETMYLSWRIEDL